VPVVEYKRRELINCKIVILWIEDLLDYSKELITQERDPDHILIIIQPLSSGLYGVHIPRELSKLNGSILEYMVLAKHQLGTQIRRCVTISHCWITTNFENGYWRDPHFLQRNNKIQGALKTFSKDLTMRKFYSNQFTKFDSKSGGSLAHTPRKEGEISNEFRLQFKLQNVGLGFTRAESETEENKNQTEESTQDNNIKEVKNEKVEQNEIKEENVVEDNNIKEEVKNENVDNIEIGKKSPFKLNLQVLETKEEENNDDTEESENESMKLGIYHETYIHVQKHTTPYLKRTLEDIELLKKR